MDNSVKAVIVEGDIEYRKLYIDTIQSLGAQIISSTGDPMTALKTIIENQPKILIMDIVLPGIDGIEYITTVKSLAPATNIIIITNLINETVMKQCNSLGVARYTNKPLKQDMISFILSQYIGFESVRKNIKPISDIIENMSNETLEKTLLELKLPFHIKGTLFTRCALRFMIKQNVPFEKILITKDIYPTVAKECDTTPSKVERGIRYCIDYILENETMDIISPDKYGVNIDGNHKLSNAKFLMILARHVLDKLEETNSCDDIVSINVRS